MGSVAPSLSASLLSALVGAGAALLVVALVGDREPAARPEPSGPREAALEERLARIESVLEGLRRSAEATDATTAERRSPADGGAPSRADELAELRESVEALRRELSATRGSGAHPPTSLRELARRPGDPSALVASFAGFDQPGFDRAAAKQRLLDDHLFWTLDQLIEAYGKPDVLNAGDTGLHLQYKPEGANASFTFLVSEGHVYFAYSDRF